MDGKRICLVPRVKGVGGMVSFQARLATGLERRGLEVCFDLDMRPLDGVLVIGGTRQLLGLWRARQRGIPVVQRLDGMNWLHRLRRTGMRHFLRAEYGNLLLTLIRHKLATRIIYQSEFSLRWWERARGKTPVPSQVVYNGVDLEVYTPQGLQEPPNDRYRILLVEGNLSGGYEWGLETAFQLAGQLAWWHSIGVELQVVGRVPPSLQASFRKRGPVPVQFTGLVPRERIPELDRTAHLMYAADINAACPNSVIEALACGLPVVAFDTGALPELVQGDAGRVVPYGGDPWKLDPPDLSALARAATEVLDDQPGFRRAARWRAAENYSIDQMVEGYLTALLG